MTQPTRTRLDIQRNLERLPPEKLRSVEDYIAFLLSSSADEPAPAVVSLEGIWEGLGFEKIEPLEEAVRSVRSEASKTLSKKFDQWNT